MVNDSKRGNHLRRSAIFAILWAKNFPASGRKEIRTEGRKDHHDSIVVGQRAEAWCRSALHPILLRTKTVLIPEHSAFVGSENSGSRPPLKTEDDSTELGLKS